MQSVAVFMNWWLGQLSSLLPAALTQMSARSPDAVVVERRQQGLNLLVRRRGREQRLTGTRDGEGGVRELRDVLRTEGGLPRLLVIRQSAEHILRKSLALPGAARRDIADILGFEIDRETPFQRDEVHWTYVVRARDVQTNMLDVELILLPRAHVDPLVDALRELTLEPAGIEVEAGNGAATLIPLGAPKRAQWLDARRPLVSVATAAAALALVALVTPFAIQQWELAAVESRIRALETSAREAAELRRQAGQLASTVDFLMKERSKNGTALAALAGATRTLPDDSYLSALSLRSGRVTLNGLSPSAAQLVGLLAQSPEFRDPSFEAPVTRAPETELETFTISVALAPMGAP